MKTDVLTLAALVFIVGLLLSTVSFSSMFGSDESSVANLSSNTASSETVRVQQTVSAHALP